MQAKFSPAEKIIIENSTPAERLDQCISELGISRTEFARKLGMTYGDLTKYIGGGKKSTLGAKYLPKLIEFGIDIFWYLTGKSIKEHTKILDPQKFESVQNIGTKHGVPYYDIDITATIAESFNDMPATPEYYIDFKPFNDCAAYLPIFGDSMFPAYKSGDIVAVKKFNNPNVILWGEAYLIVTDAEANNLRTVKLLFPHDDPEKIILRSVNPLYKGDTIINKRNVLELYIIKGKISKNM